MTTIADQGALFTLTPASDFQLGLIGAGISQSKSPALHETEARAQGIQCRYDLIDLDARGVGVAGLADLLDEAQQNGFSGLNITLPCKQAVIPLLHELSPEALAIGAVNTIRFDANRRIGYNTDARGFAKSFCSTLPHAALDRVLQFGAGGVGAATAHAILEIGAQQLTIVDVIHERAELLAKHLSLIFPAKDIRASKTPDEALCGANGIINSTPAGSTNHPGSAMQLDLLRPDLWIAEVVYAPRETALLQAARKLGCQTVDGASMLVFQAAGAFELFTGRTANIERMLSHFNKMLIS